MLPSGLIPLREGATPYVEEAEPEPEPEPEAEGKKRKQTRRGGAKARKRQSLRRAAGHHNKVQLLRKDDNMARLPGYHRECILPKVGQQDKYVLQVQDDHTPEAMDFYVHHDGINRLVEVSDRSNVSNREGVPGGGKGLFAKAVIKAGERICPYVGHERAAPCAEDVQCHYDMRMSKDVVICAHKVLYDFGYLMGYDDTIRGCRTAPISCPPNYGRYVNSVNEGEESLLNCAFVAVADGHHCMFLIAERQIEIGEELLTDYGDQFVIE